MRLDALQWTAIQSVAVALQAAVLIITALLAYRQLKHLVRNNQLEAIDRMLAIFKSFEAARTEMFHTFPLELALEDEQFAKAPPGRHQARKQSEGQLRKMLLTEEQSAALARLTPEQLEVARQVICGLNDVGQLVEDRFIPKDVFFGKYHCLVIRCCHMVEPVRRHLEERDEGGNYGQRLLRLRKRATNYNDMMPKHRDVEIFIRRGTKRRVIYRSPAPTIPRRARWFVWRTLRLY